MTKVSQKSNVDLVVYAVVSPERGQTYMVYTEDVSQPGEQPLNLPAMAVPIGIVAGQILRGFWNHHFDQGGRDQIDFVWNRTLC
jgi:hypothetical protein